MEVGRYQASGLYRNIYSSSIMYPVGWCVLESIHSSKILKRDFHTTTYRYSLELKYYLTT